MKLTTTTGTLTGLYTAAIASVAKRGLCVKCWQTFFARSCFGRPAEIFTVRTDAGAFVAFDVDRARELVGVREDAHIEPAHMLAALMAEGKLAGPGHAACLLSNVARGLIPVPVGAVSIIASVAGANVAIDGSARALLCVAAGVPTTVAILTEDEQRECTLIAPTVAGEEVVSAEVERMGKLFQSMNAQKFVTIMRAELGTDYVNELLGL